jgi:hypothetical protein
MRDRRLKFAPDARPAIGALHLAEDRLDVNQQRHIAEPAAGLKGADVRLTRSILPIAAGADLQHPALRRYRPKLSMLQDKGVSHRDSLAKCRVAEQRSVDIAPFFNPLYTHAAVGLGKTHLLQAMAHAAYENKRRVVYLTAEKKFMSSFVSSLTAHTSIAFKEDLRAIDMLIIDDVQFLQGKSIQQEFCHTLNALIDAGRQVVVAADRPPSELETLDERVLSRLKGGLCIDIGQLDEGLRVKILEARVAAALKGSRVFPCRRK